MSILQARCARFHLSMLIAAFVMWCAPVLEASADTYSGEPAMSFRLGRTAASPDCGAPCAEFIIAEGEIQNSSSFWLLFAVKRSGDRILPLVIHSPGGLVGGSMQLGRMARKLGLPVIVARAEKIDCASKDSPACASTSDVSAYRLTTRDARCFSGCTFVLMGGVERHTPDGTRVGVHMWRPDPEVMAKLRETSGDEIEEMTSRMTRGWIDDYLKEMGIDVYVLDLIETTPADDMRMLTPAEMTSVGLLPLAPRKPPVPID